MPKLNLIPEFEAMPVVFKSNPDWVCNSMRSLEPNHKKLGRSNSYQLLPNEKEDRVCYSNNPLNDVEVPINVNLE